MRKKGEKKAIAKVAKEIGKDPRNVAKIYSKYREYCEKQREDDEKTERLWKQLTGDGISSRTDATVSDK